MVDHVGLDRLVVVVGGVGLLVQTTPATAAAARRGAPCALATSLVVREDSLTLYGFDSVGERDMFETVQTVTGVGPRLALAMLSVHAPDDLRRAIAGNDLTALTKIPGVGRKGAERIVLELRDRIGPMPGGVCRASAGPRQPTATRSRTRWSVSAGRRGRPPMRSRPSRRGRTLRPMSRRCHPRRAAGAWPVNGLGARGQFSVEADRDRGWR